MTTTAVEKKRARQARYASKARSHREGWAQFILKKLRERAKKRGHVVTVTAEDLLREWPADDCCPVFGVAFEFGWASQWGPSVDQLRVGEGYVPGNIAIICRRANTIKNDATADELRRVAEWVESKQGGV